MIGVDELIKLKPREALYRLGEDILATQYKDLKLKIDWFTPGPPLQVRDDLYTKVTFFLDRAKCPVEYWDKFHSFNIFYNRLDIKEYGVIDYIKTNLPVSTSRLLEIMFARMDVGYEDRDFIRDNRINNPGVATLKVSDDSYRWMGEVNLKILGYVRSLKDIIKANPIVPNYTDNYSSSSIIRNIVTHLNRTDSTQDPVKLSIADLKFGDPITNGPNKSAVNTKIQVEAFQGDFTDSDYLYYMRRHFDYTWGDPIEIEDSPDFIRQRDLLPYLSNKLNCIITSEDIYDKQINRLAKLFTIDFREESLAYVGGITVYLSKR